MFFKKKNLCPLYLEMDELCLPQKGQSQETAPMGVEIEFAYKGG